MNNIDSFLDNKSFANIAVGCTIASNVITVKYLNGAEVSAPTENLLDSLRVKNIVDSKIVINWN